MATFYYNKYSGEDINSQWINHLQHGAYINDIDNIINYNRRELEYAINNSSKEQITAINNVCGKLDQGFDIISDYLLNINYNISELCTEINAMAAMLDWRLSQVIEEQQLTNRLLGHISELLKIPDSQKQRVYYIEQGLKYIKNAILEDSGSSFYSDALESFKSAEKIEKKDYITLNKIGQIYLYSKNHLNIRYAEEYFLLSARESYAEYVAGGTTTSLNLRPFGFQSPLKRSEVIGQVTELDGELILMCKEGKVLEAVKQYKEQSGESLYNAKKYIDDNIVPRIRDTDISRQKTNEAPTRKYNNFLVSTVESYLFAARTKYLQKNYNSAAELAEKAYKLIPDFLVAGYEQAKYLSANNQVESAVKILKSIIERDRLYALKILTDQDLSNKLPVLEMLESIQKTAYDQAKSRFDECSDIVHPNSNSRNLLVKIKNLIKIGTFFSCMKALDLLNANHTLPYKTLVDNYTTKEEEIVSPAQPLLDFIKCENENYSEFIYREDSKIKTLKRKTLIRGGIWGTLIGLILGLFDLSNYLLIVIVCSSFGLLLVFLTNLGLKNNVEETYWDV